MYLNWIFPPNNEEMHGLKDHRRLRYQRCGKNLRPAENVLEIPGTFRVSDIILVLAYAIVIIRKSK